MNVTTNDNLRSTIALAALHNVMDPEIGLNIVDLGLIYQLDFDDPGMKLYCTMTLTTQFCPMGESITDAAKEVLHDAFPEYETIINLTFDPPWRHDRISEEGKNFLNL
ncbi:MAG: metal-sulfur cluster assembly factor [Bacteroidetes bacterium]|nr:metal-sulfur cluster assembly factor [Bacteroidota bacterium]MBS1932318.1 metal-sulfur cluster assembly factor [Bacteroidota bacterium]